MIQMNDVGLTQYEEKLIDLASSSPTPQAVTLDTRK